MNILILGGGGREHAIAWRLKQSGHTVFAAPGNYGIARIGPITHRTDHLKLAQEAAVDLTVVGPEAPLVNGVADDFRAAGLLVVGPSQECAKLEGSKIYSKQFMETAGIPTADSVRTESNDAAIAALDRFKFPVVIKADGLAAGKGVIIAQDRAQAEAAIYSLGPRLVVEEFLQGEEVSFIVLSDGRNVVPFEATQDHKAAYDGDRGPNTGGMGAYCDGRIIDAATTDLILRTIIHPAIERTGFTGFLYAGIMLTAAGPKVLEFNVRLGDPETQPLMHRLDCDFGDLLYRAAKGELQGARMTWRPEPSVCVVMAAHGYPGEVRTGDIVYGTESSGAEVFHAGTRLGNKGIETTGGRVLGVTARGQTLQAAIDSAYAAVDKIHFAGAHFRRDIGKKGLARW